MANARAQFGYFCRDRHAKKTMLLLPSNQILQCPKCSFTTTVEQCYSQIPTAYATALAAGLLSLVDCSAIEVIHLGYGEFTVEYPRESRLSGDA